MNVYISLNSALLSLLRHARNHEVLLQVFGLFDSNPEITVLTTYFPSRFNFGPYLLQTAA